MAECKQCGKCCMSNGLIPPSLHRYGGDDAKLPEWLRVLVDRLREDFSDVANDYPCVFLTDDLRCAIHGLCKPQVCREYDCDNTEGGA